MPGEGLTHGPPAKKMQAAGTTGKADQPGIPCAMALRFIRGLPGAPGFLATIPGAIALRQVDTSIGVSGHHDFTVRIMLFVGAA
ncbi:hypothetical protein ACQR10_26400 [Bradyrhizobium sp. HKCCYLRH2060]|uniref:hypothetical protein n=1 Tax=Bradyrhizobium TaxID=374 RepID=UPI003EC0C869